MLSYWWAMEILLPKKVAIDGAASARRNVIELFCITNWNDTRSLTNHMWHFFLFGSEKFRSQRCVGGLDKLRTHPAIFSHSIGAIESEVFIKNLGFWCVKFWIGRYSTKYKGNMSFTMDKVILVCVVMCCVFSSVFCQEQDAVTDVNG